MIADHLIHSFDPHTNLGRCKGRSSQNMHAIRSALLVALGILILPLPGHAQNLARTGFYAGAGMSFIIEGFDTTKAHIKEETEPSPCADDEDGGCELIRHIFNAVQLADRPGANIKAGYRLHPAFALELDYQYISGFEAEVTRNDSLFSSTNTVKIEDGYAVTARAKGFLSAGMFQPYGAIGVGIADLNIEGELPREFAFADLDFVTSFSVGLDVVTIAKITFYLETSYFLTTGNIKNLDFVPIYLGVQYRF